MPRDKNRGKILAFCALFLVAMPHPCAAETIQLAGQHGTYMVPVRINGAMTLPFVLDTGASAVAIPEDVFLTLTRTGTVTTSDFLGTGTVQLADGSEHASRRFVLHEVQVGNHVVRNVIANVVSVRGDPLLGQSFLSKLPAWSIDNQSHSLVLHDQYTPRVPGAATGAPAPLPDAQPTRECDFYRAVVDGRESSEVSRVELALQCRESLGSPTLQTTSPLR